MNAIDLKRVEYRHYLESCGVMDALSYALIKLYDEVDKPLDPVAFVRQHFKRPSDENEYTDIPKRIEDMDASEMIKKQEHELKLARQEIAKLQLLLNSMSSKSPLAEHVENHDKPKTYHEIFNDPKYDETLIKKHLSEELFTKLHNLSSDESSIIDCIAKVDELRANPFGVFATNGNCYNTFADLFLPIIKDMHCVDEFNKYPECDWGDVNVFEKFPNDTILFTEISCCRSLANIPFIRGINEQNLEIILTSVQNAIQSARTDDKDIDGEFYKITDVKENEPIFDELQKSGIGFRSMNPQDHTLWPIGRGLYINCNRTQSILINEQEHLRFICKEMNGDFGMVYKNLIELIGKFSNGLEFERHEKYGWLTTNLELLGSGLCCKVCLKLKQPVDCIKELCDKSRIKITSINTTQEDNEQTIELTNRYTFGVSEFQCVKAFYDTVKEIIKLLEECGTQNDTENETQKENQNETQHETATHENVNESSSQGNSNEVNNKENDVDKSVVDKGKENEQSPVVEDDTAKNNGNNEQKGDDENVQNEQVSNTVEGDEEKASSKENIINPCEASDFNENNTDNLVEGEKVNVDISAETNQNTDNNDSEANQNENETNKSETDSPDKHDDTEDQSVKEAAKEEEEEVGAKGGEQPAEV